MTTGLTTDVAGNEIVGLAITRGPTAVVKLDSGSDLLANIRLSLADWLERRGGV